MTEPNKISVGDEVFFILKHGPSKGYVRPAKVISANGDLLDLAVFTNEQKDQTSSTVITVQAVKRGTEPGTFHEKGTVLPAKPATPAPARPSAPTAPSASPGPSRPTTPTQVPAAPAPAKPPAAPQTTQATAAAPTPASKPAQ